MARLRIKSRRRSHLKRVESELRKVAKETASDIVDDMRILMSQAKTGVPMPGPKHRTRSKYIKGGGRRSAPGEAPAVETAKLFRSLTNRITHSRGLLIIHIGTNAKANGKNYPLFLELGTRKMAARPYMRPAMKMNMGPLKKRLSRLARVKVLRG